MITSHFGRTALSVLMGLTIGNAQAALVDRGGGLVYDSDLNITWLADFNYFGTNLRSTPNLISQVLAAVPTITNPTDRYSSYGVGGSPLPYTLSQDDFLDRSAQGNTSLLSWYGAQAFASQLTYGGYSDWRVAGKFVTDHAAFSNELRHLWKYELEIALDNPGGNPQEVGKFQGAANFGGGYWLSDYFSGNGYLSSCVCDTSSIGGETGSYTRTDVMFVRDGDVAAPIPEPGTIALLGIGLVGLSYTRRKR